MQWESALLFSMFFFIHVSLVLCKAGNTCELLICLKYSSAFIGKAGPLFSAVWDITNLFCVVWRIHSWNIKGHWCSSSLFTYLTGACTVSYIKSFRYCILKIGKDWIWYLDISFSFTFPFVWAFFFFCVCVCVLGRGSRGIFNGRNRICFYSVLQSFLHVQQFKQVNLHAVVDDVEFNQMVHQTFEKTLNVKPIISTMLSILHICVCPSGNHNRITFSLKNML